MPSELRARKPMATTSSEGAAAKQPLIDNKKPQQDAKKSVPFKASLTNPFYVWCVPLTWIIYGLDVIVFSASVIMPLKWLASKLTRAQSVAVPGGQGPCHRRRLAQGLATTPFDGVKTAHEMLQASFRKYESVKACGTRQYLGTHQGPKDKFPKAMFGDTTWLSYGQLNERVTAFGAGLMKYGLKPFQGNPDEYEASNGPHTILVYENTSMYWTTACVGAWSQSLIVATSYATLGMDSVANAIQETNASCIVCNFNDVTKVLSLTKSCPTLKTIIYTFCNVEREKWGTQPAASPPSGVVAVSMEEVIEAGRAAPVPFAAPKPTSVAVVMYTSGSTGKPKGVVLKHESLVSATAGLTQHLEQAASSGLQKGNETYLAYLPAAHILELCAETSMMALGITMGYADPKTLSSKGAVRRRGDGSISEQAIPAPKPNASEAPGAIQEFCPTVMAGVPKVWDIFKKGVEEVLSHPKAGVKRYLIQTAFSWRAAALNSGRASPVTYLLFGTFRKMLGGRLKVAITGGGPCSSEVQTFVRTCFCPVFVQGYALTETCCAGTVQDFSDTRDGIVGAPVASVEMNLEAVDITDQTGQKYLPDDRFHNFKSGGVVGKYPCLGRGEICIRGPPVAAGYFKQQSKTKEAYIPDGEGGVWFHTGDVGVFLPDGTLRIVDRVKNLIKLKGAEYIAIENMEVVYGNSVYVDGMNGGVMCYGDGDMDRPVAVVQANVPKLQEWAANNGVAYSSVAELCANEDTKKMVLDDLVKNGKAGGLSTLEILCAVLLAAGEGDDDTPISLTSKWTPENGALTATRKLNRNPIKDAMEKEFEQLKVKGIR